MPKSLQFIFLRVWFEYPPLDTVLKECLAKNKRGLTLLTLTRMLNLGYEVNIKIKCIKNGNATENKTIQI